MKITLLFIGLFLGFILPVWAQQTEPSAFRSSFNERKKSVMDANELRSTYHNYGQGGRVNPNLADEFSYEFPKNSRREYMLFQMVFVGAEVESQSGNGDPFHVVDIANLRSEPGTGDSWNLNPVVGFSNPASRELPRSDRGFGSPLGNTWPGVWPDKLLDGGDGWAGSWNGFFGRDQFNADLEFYYRMGDDQYDRYVESATRQWRPDSTDPSRGGLGLLIDTRILSWTQTLISNAHFNIFEVTNDASFDYDKMAFGIWIADLVAEDGSNDIPQFDVLRSIGFITDGNRLNFPDFFEGPVGEMGIRFLETPGNSLDGIDNDGDSFEYDIRFPLFFKVGNEDLFDLLLTNRNGFFDTKADIDSRVPTFTAEDFQANTFSPGDKLVLITQDFKRVIVEYVPGKTVQTRGLPPFTLPPNGFSRIEDFLPESDSNFGVHVDLVDNDFDGLIDESTPNHFEKQTLNNQGVASIVPVRFINYFEFAIGDTVEPGLIISNREFRERMASDEAYRNFIETNYQGNIRNHTTSGPMIDEARDDFFDNDNDWVASSDDIGIFGDLDSPSTGAGDGFPNSGAGTVFPGEPNIDKTDVSETDLIGVSRASIFRAGLLQTLQDEENWNLYMAPGDFSLGDGTAANEDRDIFVSSSLFPLLKGQTQRFAIAITAAQTKSQNQADDREANFRSLEQSNNAYLADYQFATAPKPPRVTAVAGDGVVTLYWDTESENSFDRFVNRLTGNGNDFQGYKVYRSTDVGLNDIRTITDAFGTAQFRTPLAIFDKVDEFSGLHPVPINGTQFNMGNNSGLQRVFVDRNVNNGKTYFYAVTGFDSGLEIGGIAPSESSIQASREPDGTVTLGENVVMVRPAASAAGIISAENPQPSVISGSGLSNTRTIDIDIVNPSEVLPDNTYRIVFEDTVKVTLNGAGTARIAPDTVLTKNFSLLNISRAPVDTVIARSTAFNGQDIPVVDGLRLSVVNEIRRGINQNSVRWTTQADGQPHQAQVTVNSFNQVINDYMVVVGDLGFGQSSDLPIVVSGIERTFPSIPTNFKVISEITGEEIKYAFFEPNVADPNSQPGELTAIQVGQTNLSDNIFLIEDFGDQQDVDSYRIRLNFNAQTRNPQAGDTLRFSIFKPFNSQDIFEFRIAPENTQRFDGNQAKDDLDRIRVVPNPYVVTSPFEPPITSSSFQQQRELHFTHMPVPSTLRIFTVAGNLIREMRFDENDSRVHNGTFIWNMLTKDNLEISYGVYLFHVDAPGIGEHMDKFAVIK